MLESSDDKSAIKAFYQLNQDIKLIYSNWVLGPNGVIVGRPVIKRDRIRTAFNHAYFKTALLESLPFLEGITISSSELYAEFNKLKGSKVIGIDSNGNVVGSDEKGTNVIFGRKWNAIEEEFWHRHRLTLLKEFEFAEVGGMQMVFDDETIKELIDYSFIAPMFNDDPRYVMYLGISEFPLLKRYKNLTASTSVPDNKDYFDVVFKTFNDSGERFVIKRRFVKM